MIAAVIDIGSNTMRMSVYKIEGQKFTVLLSKKETAGLVNYITEGEMSEEGIGVLIRSVYKELHADHETGAADNK